jgi:glycosyltransferase involved in cell wall biosynthesis
MNILYVSYTGKILGGGEISLINLLEKLDRASFTPFLLVPDEGELEKAARKLNIEVFIIDYRKIKNPLNLARSLYIIKKIVQIIKNKKIAIIHCNSTGGLTVLAAIATRLCAIPFIWHVRSVDNDKLIDWILTCLSTKIIIISNAVTKRLAWLHTKKIELVHNGVNLDRFHPSTEANALRESFAKDENTVVIGTVGRYHPIKGYKYFLSAASEVLKSITNAKFVIAGLDYNEQNLYLTELKELACRLKIDDKIIFIGNCQDVNAVTNALDICVSTSPNEPFGRNIIEAMACAKPFIAFDSGGPREIIENGISGILVEPKNSLRLAQEIIKLSLNPTIRKTLGENARKRVEQKFTSDIHARNIETIYRKLHFPNSRNII